MRAKKQKRPAANSNFDGIVKADIQCVGGKNRMVHIGTTLILRLGFKKTADLKVVSQALSGIGWRPARTYRRRFHRDLDSGCKEARFYQWGSGCFGSWTPDEHRSKLPELRASLRGLGLLDSPRKKSKR